ncbi:OLC1v1009535C1 [Oldenlandia corymbosa var. corymbosa]|uniref:OLC1v1009535C1 n=1 Tax=Oldenlandia corymbosa var. corymbosa TaxID=529605 RepID=A0AAV1DP56_OLDCO|nr:OLC1v1009535C1 [Oldenlandia corymbosa var. corymbosa]
MPETSAKWESNDSDSTVPAALGFKDSDSREADVECIAIDLKAGLHRSRCLNIVSDDDNYNEVAGHARTPVEGRLLDATKGILEVNCCGWFSAAALLDSIPHLHYWPLGIATVCFWKFPPYDILNEFQKGLSHIAVVYRDLNKTKEIAKKAEDKKNAGFKSNLNDASNKDGEQAIKRSPPPTPVFKKRHRGCSSCSLDLENSPIPEFPPNEVVLSVITMEDVIGELQVLSLNQNQRNHFFFPLCWRN